ncbi:lipase [Gordonia araii NBRC 100433]|nr:lipase [Gordonia araii NBRC 100433]
MKASLVAAASAVIATAGLLSVAPADAAPPKTRVILTPGQSVGGTSVIPASGVMADNLTSRGYPTTLVDLPGVDLRKDARTVAAAVERTRRAHPRDRIALVAHSVSGISARWYLKELGGASKVATYVAIGTAQYGSPASCTADIARENCPKTPFFRRLNAGDDTPGPTKYYGIRSENEYADGHLDGGQCRVTPIPINYVPAGFDHTIEPITPAVWDAVAASLAGRCKGRFVNTPDGVLTARGSMLPNAPYFREYKPSR